MRLSLCLVHALLATAAAARCCGPGCRGADTGPQSHYDEKYFAWQKKAGMEKARSQDWAAFIGARKNETVLDLGAGTGAILASLKGRVQRVVAVEYNDHAARFMRRHSPEIVRYKYQKTNRRQISCARAP